MYEGVDRTPKPLFTPSKGGETTFDIDVDAKVESMMDLVKAEEYNEEKIGNEDDEKTDAAVKKFVLSDAALARKYSAKMTETETFFPLHIPGIQVQDDDDDLTDAITVKNKAYEDNVERHKEKDKFISRHAQTFNNTQRTKAIQVRPSETRSTGAQITTWDIYDSYQERDEQELNAAKQSVDQFVTISTKAQETTASSGGMSSSTIDGAGVGSESVVDGHEGKGGAGTLNMASPFERILRTPGFKERLDVIEQAVVQKIIHNQQLLFRNHPDAIDPETGERISAPKQENKEAEPPTVEAVAVPTEATPKDGAVDPDAAVGGGGPEGEAGEKVSSSAGATTGPRSRLTHLWTFVCPLSTGKNVACMCFNKQNQDLLAVGYGDFKFGNNETGAVMFWSLKNPTFPAKVIDTKFGVTSLDFCTEHPHLLAVGLYDGSVAIYDIRDKEDKPSLESQHATGKHSEPVWGVKWVAKEMNKEQQQLVSISTDGSVQQWSMKKGLVPHQLMQLKRIPNKEQLVTQHMEGISREASGLCFDFPINDCTQYFAGTEGGIIHKCSVSYNEQTLENFFGHRGPVYKVKASPFYPDTFLSCSADWTCALWSQKSVKPLHVFQSGYDYMMDIEWSPANACVFATVSRDGRVEVWDLEKKIMDPEIKHHVEDKELSSVLFAPKGPVLLTGSNDGTIDVYRINGVDLDDKNKWTLEQQVERLVKAMSEQSSDSG